MYYLLSININVVQQSFSVLDDHIIITANTILCMLAILLPNFVHVSY